MIGKLFHLCNFGIATFEARNPHSPRRLTHRNVIDLNKILLLVEKDLYYEDWSVPWQDIFAIVAEANNFIKMEKNIYHDNVGNPIYMSNYFTPVTQMHKFLLINKVILMSKSRFESLLEDKSIYMHE